MVSEERLRPTQAINLDGEDVRIERNWLIWPRTKWTRIRANVEGLVYKPADNPAAAVCSIDLDSDPGICGIDRDLPLEKYDPLRLVTPSSWDRKFLMRVSHRK